MHQQFRDIIANLPLQTNLYVSNFTPLALYHYALDRGMLIKLLPSTLQGLIDTRALKPFDPDKNVHIITWPFFHNNSTDSVLLPMQNSHHFTLHTITPQPQYDLENIQRVFRKQLQDSVDLDVGDITSDQFFIINLRPHMFCPKEGIVDALKSADVKFHIQLDALYLEDAFQSQKRLHMSAHECRLSFIALNCQVSPQEAIKSSQILLQALENESYRRCSF